MEVELPQNGCNVYYGSYIDNYNGGIRTRYYINNNKLVESSRATYTGSLSNYHCVTTGDILYNPEAQIYFGAISAVIIAVALILIYHIIVKRLLR